MLKLIESVISPCNCTYKTHREKAAERILTAIEPYFNKDLDDRPEELKKNKIDELVSSIGDTWAKSENKK